MAPSLDPRMRKHDDSAIFGVLPGARELEVLNLRRLIHLIPGSEPRLLSEHSSDFELLEWLNWRVFMSKLWVLEEHGSGFSAEIDAAGRTERSKFISGSSIRRFLRVSFSVDKPIGGGRENP
ncbi:hypothetical protein OSB04_015752 [Centaurea solstitialis]|uniref:Uncharacterized protein n=1 Tax=Centaurea solstitialis TaxID=347529 RepID=A0AA38W7T2_9ASTR|nr:hypothetical protein OSB04_015752 [Centaurea solstitialis]